jgi:hypothetical protein
MLGILHVLSSPICSGNFATFPRTYISPQTAGTGKLWGDPLPRNIALYPSIAVGTFSKGRTRLLLPQRLLPLLDQAGTYHLA